VCEKSDGIRYLLWLTDDGRNPPLEIQYLIDRKNDYWYMPNGRLHFPVEGDEQGFHRDTLVDGELVVDTLPNGEKQPRFLVFDCLVLDKTNLMERTLDKRLAYFKSKVYEPYRALFKKYPDELRFQAFELQLKEMQFSYGITMMFKDIIPRLKHANDGLIFTCRNAEYRPGTDPHILKWKPATENTIDFRIELHFKMIEPDEEDMAEGLTEPWEDYNSIPDAELYQYNGDGRGREKYTKFADLYLSEEEWETMKIPNDPISGRIVECALDEQGRWRLHRFRDDKLEANHSSTVQSVMDSIRDSVDREQLEDAAMDIKSAWKSRQAAAGAVPKR